MTSGVGSRLSLSYGAPVIWYGGSPVIFISAGLEEMKCAGRKGVFLVVVILIAVYIQFSAALCGRGSIAGSSDILVKVVVI